MGSTQSKISFIFDTLKKDKLQHQLRRSPQKPQDSNDKGHATEPKGQQPAQSDPSSTPKKEESIKSEGDPILKKDVDSCPPAQEDEGVEDPGNISGTLLEKEAGSSETATRVEEDEKKKRSGKSFLIKVRSLSFKRAKRDTSEVEIAKPLGPKDEGEHDTSVLVEEPPRERSTPISLVKKMRSLRITKRSKCAENDGTHAEVEDDSEKIEEKASPAEEQPSVEAGETCEPTEDQEEEGVEAPEIKTDQDAVAPSITEVHPTEETKVQDKEYETNKEN